MNFQEMFGSAVWVTPSEDCNTPYIRKIINVFDLKSAQITVCGLGFYILKINGQKVSDDLFVTLPTQYHEIATVYGEEFSNRIICQKYDVTDFLKDGENVIGFLLGLGYYRYHGRGKYSDYGCVKACFKLETVDNSGNKSVFFSDGDMRWSSSFVTECDNFLVGETQNFNYEQSGWDAPGFDDSGWKSVQSVKVPDTEYVYTTCPADKCYDAVVPKVVFENQLFKIYDIGQNDAGWAVIRIPEGFSGYAYIRFAEELCSTGLANDKTYNQYFCLIGDGREHTTHPMLTWHGFRYAEVPKSVEMISFLPVHSNIPVRSEFNCSNEVLNWLFNTFIHTVQSNMHCGLLDDCPHIERLGYTGDGQVLSETVQLLFNAKDFYKKWIQDIFDTQDKITGHVQYLAPLVPNGGGPGGYGCAIIEVPYNYYKNYGDASILEPAFERAKKYFSYLDKHSENNLVVSDQPGAWCLGDWCTAELIQIPDPFVNTYFYVKSLNRAIEIAKIIGRQEEVPELEKKREIVKSALVDKYYDPDTGCFCKSVQGANAFAVDIGLGDNRTYQQLVEFYDKYGMFDTGIFGTEILPRVLFENGNDELAFKILSSNGKYSFGNWMNQGATTLWEYWTGDRSHNHPMFGAVTKYLIQYILGIRQKEGSCGYKDLLISPADISLNNANGSVEFEYGRVSVSIDRSPDGASFEIDIPSGVTANFIYRGISKVLNGGHNSIHISV